MINFVARLREALSRPLPGLDAQLRMAPEPRLGWDPLKFPDGARDGAALLLVYPHDETLHIPVSGFLLHPIVGYTSMRPAFQRAEWEVARIIEAPVSVLSDPAVVKREIRTRVVNGRSIDVDVPYFDIDGEKVWGATAMVLAEFCAILSS